MQEDPPESTNPFQSPVALMSGGNNGSVYNSTDFMYKQPAALVHYDDCFI